MVLINGWYFDFCKKKAFRTREADGVYQIRELRSVGTPPSIVKLSETRIYTNFFDEPEDYFNDIIDQKYREHLLNQEIEEMLTD